MATALAPPNATVWAPLGLFTMELVASGSKKRRLDDRIPRMINSSPSLTGAVVEADESMVEKKERSSLQ
jgi:hypothetical protein